jgi:stearoyl-CoA desaturase (delta-9 desaturase)
VIIGGEELHNNHHTYPTSAKLSVKPFEFDIGWAYIRILQMLGLATVRKTPPKLALGSVRTQADSRTLEALIANRYEVMAHYAKQVREVCGGELAKLRSQGQSHGVRWMNLRLARRWLHRDEDKIPVDVKPQLASAMADHPMLAKLIAMREELRLLWTRTNVSPSQLVADLQAWCRKAEESGIAMLQEFSMRLRAAQAV